MENLSDELLIEAYYKAKKLNLKSEFTELIAEELEKRTINAVI